MMQDDGVRGRHAISSGWCFAEGYPANDRLTTDVIAAQWFRSFFRHGRAKARSASSR
jgi:hypothetical protein